MSSDTDAEVRQFQSALHFARSMRGRLSPDESFVQLEPVLLSLELQASHGAVVALREREGDAGVDDCVSRVASSGRGFAALASLGLDLGSAAAERKAEVLRLWEGSGAMPRSVAIAEYVHQLSRGVEEFSEVLASAQGAGGWGGGAPDDLAHGTSSAEGEALRHAGKDLHSSLPPGMSEKLPLRVYLEDLAKSEFKTIVLDPRRRKTWSAGNICLLLQEQLQRARSGDDFSLWSLYASKDGRHLSEEPVGASGNIDAIPGVRLFGPGATGKLVFRRRPGAEAQPADERRRASATTAPDDARLIFRRHPSFAGELAPLAIDDDAPLPRALPKSLPVKREYARNPFFCIGTRSPLRKKLVLLIEWKWFDRVIAFCIALNAICMALQDLQQIDFATGEKLNAGWRNAFGAFLDPIFTWVFYVEFLLKIFAMGFVCGNGAYLHDAWNWLDFIVVLSSMLEQLEDYIPGMPKLKALRTFRVLRPLRSLNRFPQLRGLVVALLSSLPALTSVVGLLFTLLLVFSLLGLQLWGATGDLKARCRLTPHPVKWPPSGGLGMTGLGTNATVGEISTLIGAAYAAGGYGAAAWLEPCLRDSAGAPSAGDGPGASSKGTSIWTTSQPCIWPIAQVGPSVDRGCQTRGAQVDTYHCPRNVSGPVEWCGSDWDSYGNARFANAAFGRASYMNVYSGYGFVAFDNLFTSLFTLFEVITLEAWTTVTYRVQDSFNGTVGTLYFGFLVMLGAFVVLNLVLAVMWEAFSDYQEGEKRERYKAFAAEKFRQLDHEGLGSLPLEDLHLTAEVRSLTRKQAKTIVSHAHVQGTGMIDVHEFTIAMEQCCAIDPGHDPDLRKKLHLDKKPKDAGRATPGFGRSLCHSLVHWNVPWLGRIARAPRLDRFVITCIMLNTLLLCASYHGQPPSEVGLLEMAGFALSVIFALEMFVKIAGLGVSEYFSDSFNFVDCFTVLASFAELAIATPAFFSGQDPAPGAAGGVMSALRTLRVFRVLKMLSKFEGLRLMTNTTIKLVASVLNFGTLLLLFMFIFALLGMQLFANKMKFDEGGLRIPVTDLRWQTVVSQRTNFDDFAKSFMSVFQILTGEDWNAIMWDARRAAGSTSLLFFGLVVIVGNFILLNLFIAILLGGFDDEAKLAHTEKRIREQHDAKLADIKLAKLEQLAERAADALGTDGAEAEQLDSGLAIADDAELKKPKSVAAPPQPSGLGLVRNYAKLIIQHPYFGRIVMSCIFFSSILLALAEPLSDPHAPLSTFLDLADFVVSIIFMVECALKICALGFVWSKGSYLRDGWNKLDFFIVCVSIVNLVMKDSKIGALRGMRALRALRPLRVISRNPGLKTVVNALIKSIPNILNIALIITIAYLIFAIIGVNLYKGLLFKCAGAGWDQLSQEQQLLVESPVAFVQLSPVQSKWAPGSYSSATSRAVCVWLGSATSELYWQRSLPQNFDNVFNALLTLFEMSTTEGWIAITWSLSDGTAVDMQPCNRERGSCPQGAVVFSMLFLTISTFFMINLFVGVVVDNFNRLKLENDGHSVLLTSDQQRWLDVQRVMAKITLSDVAMKPKGSSLWAWFRGFCFELSDESSGNLAVPFEMLIIVCIGLNTVVMCCRHFGQPDSWTVFIDVANLVFAGIFTLEAIIKLLGLGVRHYFRSGWNRFDFLIVVATDSGILVRLITGTDVGTLASVIRMFRLGRIVRLVRKARNIRALCNTLILTLPTLANVACLMALLFFIYAAMGVQLFGKVRLGSTMTAHANFQTFGVAMQTLLRSATGESWNFIMYDAAGNRLRGKQTISGVNCSTEWYGAQSNPCACDVDPQWQEDYRLRACGYEGALDPPFCQPLNGCGDMLAYPFFVSFTLIISWVFVNLFIAVIIEGFSCSNDVESGNSESAAGDGEVGLTVAEYQEFCKMWMKYDTNLTWLMDDTKLFTMMCKLPKPLGFELGVQPSDVEMLNKLAPLRLTQFEVDGKMMFEFEDVSRALAKNVVLQIGQAHDATAGDHAGEQELLERAGTKMVARTAGAREVGETPRAGDLKLKSGDLLRVGGKKAPVKDRTVRVPDAGHKAHMRDHMTQQQIALNGWLDEVVV